MNGIAKSLGGSLFSGHSVYIYILDHSSHATAAIYVPPGAHVGPRHCCYRTAQSVSWPHGVKGVPEPGLVWFR